MLFVLPVPFCYESCWVADLRGELCLYAPTQKVQLQQNCPHSKSLHTLVSTMVVAPQKEPNPGYTKSRRNTNTHTHTLFGWAYSQQQDQTSAMPWWKWCRETRGVKSMIVYISECWNFHCISDTCLPAPAPWWRLFQLGTHGWGRGWVETGIEGIFRPLYFCPATPVTCPV